MEQQKKRLENLSDNDLLREIIDYPYGKIITIGVIGLFWKLAVSIPSRIVCISLGVLSIGLVKELIRVIMQWVQGFI